jgi:diaminopimelate epimerase
MKIKFTKMHGLGNDFIIIENMKKEIFLSSKQVRSICNRNFGVGGDGVILIERKDGADCFMNYYNSDGTVAEMCGNGIRCTAKFFQEKISPKKKELLVDTRAGIKKIICHDDGTFSVNMGKPKFSHKDFPKGLVEISNFSFECVSVGNPHAIVFVNNIENIDLISIGPRVEHNPHFPNKINVQFVEKVTNNKLKMLTWERGAGATLACGTGATAVYSLAHRKGIINGETNIQLPGGNLIMSMNEKGEVIMRGGADISFEGEIEVV